MTTRISGRALTWRASEARRTVGLPRARLAARAGSTTASMYPTTGMRASRPTATRPGEEERRAAGRGAAAPGATDHRSGRNRADNAADDAASRAQPPVHEQPAITPTTIAPSSVRRTRSEPGEHAREGDSGGDPDSDSDSDQPEMVCPVTHFGDQCTEGRWFQAPDHIHTECARPGAVDDPMVEGDGDVPHLAHDDLAVPGHGARPDAVQPQDRDLRMVDQRRHEDAAEPAGARDREGRVAQLVGLERAGGHPRRAARSRRRSPRRRAGRSRGRRGRPEPPPCRPPRRGRSGRAARSRRRRSSRSAPGTLSSVARCRLQRGRHQEIEVEAAEVALLLLDEGHRPGSRGACARPARRSRADATYRYPLALEGVRLRRERRPR